MENQELSTEIEEKLIISDLSKKYLNETRKWSNFLGIMGFISVGIMVIAGIAMFAVFSFLPEANNSVMLFDFRYLALVYIILAVIYFFPANYLYQFSSKVKTALAKTNNDELEKSFGLLKSLYKFAGIATIVILLLYPALIITFVIIGANNNF